MELKHPPPPPQNVVTQHFKTVQADRLIPKATLVCTWVVLVESFKRHKGVLVVSTPTARWSGHQNPNHGIPLWGAHLYNTAIQSNGTTKDQIIILINARTI